jgi:ABC-2 type transport system permease protein
MKIFAAPTEHRAWRSFSTLLRREILRFLSVAGQTLLAPMVSATLYLLIFGVSLGSKISLYPDLSYLQFVVPGLVLMGVLNNSFANSSSSLFMAKFLGSIADLLVTPLTPAHYILAYTLSSVLRGFLVGGVVLGISCIFTDLPWIDPMGALAMALLTSFLFSQLGILAALVSNTFDQLSVYTNFLILPLTYLGGLFYPVSELPPFWAGLSHFNPIYYLIDGFRQSLVGKGDLPLWVDFSVGGTLALVLAMLAAFLLGRGYRLKT